ncbi:MAG: hypothetical protein ACOCP8_03825 [archaeon]
MGDEKIVCDSKENFSYTSLKVKKPTLKYVNKFLELDCKIDLMKYDIFPNAKEITETYAVYHAIRSNRNKFSISWNWDDNNTFISIGDGSTPRTAAFFAFMTNWDCHSVDPQLNIEEKYDNIKRLHLYDKKIQEVNFDTDVAILSFVHSHVDVDESLKSINADEYFIVAMPCCQELSIDDREPDMVYSDWGCFSPKRKVKIWNLKDY